MSIRFALTLEKPLDITVRGWREILKTAWRAVGDYWEEHFKMRHFGPDAPGRYGYKYRSVNYLRKKWRYGALFPWSIHDSGQTLLVYHGKLRAAVRPRHAPRAFPSRVTVEIPGPRYLQMTPRQSGRPNLGEELTRITDEEKAELEAVWLAAFNAAERDYRDPVVLTGS